MKLIHLLVLLLTIPGLAFSARYPMIKDLEVEIDSIGATYRYTQFIGEISSAEGNIEIPEGWYVGVAHRHYGSEGSAAIVTMYKGIRVTKTMTLEQAAMAAYRNDYYRNSEIHIGSNAVTECVGYVASAKKGIPWEQAIYPTHTCLETMPGKEWCKLVSPSLLLNHGTVTLADDYPVALGQVQVECSIGTKARLSLSRSPEGTLDLGGGGKSTLYGPEGQLISNGKAIDFPRGESSVNIISKLDGVKPGYWSASGTLIIEPM